MISSFCDATITTQEFENNDHLLSESIRPRATSTIIIPPSGNIQLSSSCPGTKNNIFPEFIKDADDEYFDSPQGFLNIVKEHEENYLNACTYASATYKRWYDKVLPYDEYCAHRYTNPDTYYFQMSIDFSTYFSNHHNISKNLKERHEDADEECILSYEDLLFVKEHI